MRRLGISILIVIAIAGAAFGLRRSAAAGASGGNDPAFLATPYQPAWRLVPLATALDELARSAGVAVDRSAIAREPGDRPVVLVAVQPITVGATLAMLERCAPVRFTVAANGFRAAASEAAVRPPLETRRYAPSDYGLLIPLDPRGPGEPLGLRDWEAEGAEPQSLFVHGGPPAPRTREPVDLATLSDYLRREVMPHSWAGDGVGIEGRAETELVLRQSPQVHAAIHAALLDLGRLTRRKQWQVTFGLQPPQAGFATGIVTSTQARDLAQRLSARETQTLTGVLGDLSAGRRTQERSLVVGADVIAGRLDPLTRVVRHGRSVELTAYDGRESCLLEGRLCWVDEAEPLRLSELRASPPAGKAAADPPAAAALPAERVQLQLPALWTWRPAGEWCLPHGRALVLCAAHPAGQAVIVIEDVTPAATLEAEDPVAIADPTPPAAITLDLDVQPVSALIDALATACGTGIQIDAAVIPRLEDRLTVSYPGLPWPVVVEHLAANHALDASLQDGFLRIAQHDPHAPPRGLVHRIYDVRAMNRPVQAHPAPSLSLPDGNRNRLPAIEAGVQPEVNELIETIQSEVDPDSWSHEGAAIEDYDGAVVLTNTPHAHRATGALLTTIERQRTVQVVSRLHPLPSPPADAPAILDAARWAALSAQASPAIAVIVGRNGQLQSHYAGIQRLALADAEVMEGFLLPRVRLLTAGLSLQVRATSTLAGVDAEVALAVSSDADGSPAAITGADGQPLATLAVPYANVAHCADRRLIPPGGAALYRCGGRVYALACEVLDPRK
jgi:hypothetical protein